MLLKAESYMVDYGLFEEWIEKADEDFGYASLSLDEEFEYFPQICFHFQQAAEKYLKAYIIQKNLEFNKIHNLIVLLKVCAKEDSSFEVLKASCEFLNRFYVDTRYPVHWPVLRSKEVAQEARDYAKQMQDFVKSKLCLNIL